VRPLGVTGASRLDDGELQFVPISTLARTPVTGPRFADMHPRSDPPTGLICGRSAWLAPGRALVKAPGKGLLQSTPDETREMTTELSFG